jgi:hypothetical protein
MKGYTFYLEYLSKRDKRKGNHLGNCLAVFGKWFKSGESYCKEAIGAVQNYPNNAVCGTSTSDGYLRYNCKRISERTARTIHPNLFKVLDSEK